MLAKAEVVWLGRANLRLWAPGGTKEMSLQGLARSYRSRAEQFRTLADKDRGTQTATMLLSAARSCDEMAEIAYAIERTHHNLQNPTAFQAVGRSSGGTENISAPIGTGSDSTSTVLPNPTSDDVSRIDWLALVFVSRYASAGLLVLLVMLSVAAWTLSMDHTAVMSAPMGIAADGGGVADNGMSGMAMAGMPAAGWSISDAATFAFVWTVMMGAMMSPAIAPMLIAFASVKARSEQALAVPTGIFGAGYLLVWATAGLLVYGLIQIGTDVATSLAPTQWAPITLCPILVAAGLYQFTSLKGICLHHCRSPFAFVVRHWQEGRIGALLLGVRHGVYCFGCCWVLFAVLAAANMMSMAWMVLITLVVFVERTFPHGHVIALVVGAVLLVLGSAVGAGAVPVDWFR